MGLCFVLDICLCEYTCAWTGNTSVDTVECSGEAGGLRVETDGRARYGGIGTVFSIECGSVIML